MKDVYLKNEGYSLPRPWEGMKEWYRRVPQPHPAYLGAVEGCDWQYDAAERQCDEYPYHASLQGGPTPGSPPGEPSKWTGFTLRLVDAKENIDEGRNYGAFLGACFRSGSLGEAFLVIPTPQLPTNHVCVPR